MQAIVAYKHALYFPSLFFFLDISLSNDSIYVDRSGASSFHLFLINGFKLHFDLLIEFHSFNLVSMEVVQGPIKLSLKFNF